MILSASLALAFVSALPIKTLSPCENSRNVIRIYSEGACNDNGDWIEFEASQNGVSSYGQSVMLDVPCDASSSILGSEESTHFNLGGFSKCVSFKSAQLISVVSHVPAKHSEFSFDSLFDLKKRSDTESDDEGDGGPIDEKKRSDTESDDEGDGGPIDEKKRSDTESDDEGDGGPIDEKKRSDTESDDEGDGGPIDEKKRSDTESDDEGDGGDVGDHDED